MSHPFPQAELNQTAEQVLKLAMQEADAAEVTIGYDRGFSVTARSGDVESLEHEQSKDLTVTVYSKQRTGSASTTDLSQTAIHATVAKACAIARYAEADAYAGLADKDELAFTYPELELYHPWQITPREAIEKTIEIERYALSLDSRLTQSEGIVLSNYDSFEVYANSLGFMGSYPESSQSLTCYLLAETGSGMQRDYAYTSACKASELEEFNAVAKRAASYTLQRLDARKLSTRNCPVLMTPRMAKSFWRSLVAAISGSSIYREMSLLCGKLDQQILPVHISLTQHPHIKGGMNSAPYDDEGVKTRELAYIENGIFKSYIMGSYSARKLGLKTTGNAGGVFNLKVSHGKNSFADLVKKMHTGLIVVEMLGQGVNIINGNYSRAAVGLWVENGEVQYPVEEITIAGNLNNLYKNIIAVGDDVDARSSIHTGSILIEEMRVGGS